MSRISRQGKAEEEMRGYQFENGLVLSRELVDSCCQEALKAIKSELPEENQIYEVFLFITKECGERLRFKKIEL